MTRFHKYGYGPMKAIANLLAGHNPQRTIRQRSIHSTKAIMIFLIIVTNVVAWPHSAQADIADLSIEELMDIEVTSVSRKPEKLSETAAAVFVISQEDIRRSGAASIPELLRMVPGMQVASIDANKWAVSSRGFNGRFANKMLVLVDGRSVYTSLFSGVLWEMLSPALDDIKRIEVIRGPGASLWGANAVNGVINIITKEAEDVQGGFVKAGFGKEEKSSGEIRYGGSINKHASYRSYLNYYNRDSYINSAGSRGSDSWDIYHGGFRVDWDVSDHDNLIFLGSIDKGDMGNIYTTITSLNYPYRESFNWRSDKDHFNFQSRWEHTFSPSSDLALQAYLDQQEFVEGLMSYSERVADIDFQHRFPLSNSNEIIWGAGFRYISDELESSFAIKHYPESRDTHLISAFVQDNLEIFPNRLRFTVGSKFEHNSYTGFEFQPNARLIWTLNNNHSIWMAASRALRTPSRSENDVRYIAEVFPAGMLSPGAPLTIIANEGNRGYESEELIAYELGYRVNVSSRLSFDLATFYNDYDNLRGHIMGEPYMENTPEPVHMTIPIWVDNTVEGESYGAEISARWDIIDWWRIYSSYSYLNIRQYKKDGSNTPLLFGEEGQNPNHQVYSMSSFDLPNNIELDIMTRFVDRLPALDVDSYFELDCRLGYNLYKNIEISAVGRNLLNSYHTEFTPDFIETEPTNVERSVYGYVKLGF